MDIGKKSWRSKKLEENCKLIEIFVFLQTKVKHERLNFETGMSSCKHKWQQTKYEHDADRRPSQCMNSYAQNGRFRFRSQQGRLFLMSWSRCKQQWSIRVFSFECGSSRIERRIGMCCMSSRKPRTRENMTRLRRNWFIATSNIVAVRNHYHVANWAMLEMTWEKVKSGGSPITSTSFSSSSLLFCVKMENWPADRLLFVAVDC